MKRSGIIAFSLIVILVVAGLAGFIMYRRGTFGTAGLIREADGSDYSAVFLTNGQVYFGKMYSQGEIVDLRDIYYLQVNNQEIQSGEAAENADQQNNVVLVKLGSELHGPTDKMVINGSQVLFTENIKESSKVFEAIKKYQDENK